MSVLRANSFVAAIVAASLLAASPSGAQEPVRPEQELTEEVEVRLQTARIRIEPGFAAEPGECLGMDIPDLKVSLRGERVEDPGDLTLDRERRPVLHALLIDTSGSMRGKLRFVREAASDYVSNFDPEYDRGLVVTFDESVLLLTGATADKQELLRGIQNVRMSGSTTLNDGLFYLIHELDGHRDRSVILLLSDGMDTGSLYDRHHVLELLDTRGNLSVFSIGLTVPMLGPVLRSGATSIKKFLYQLANRTNGKMFDVPAGSRLDKVYLRIREMLENEAVLTVVDSDPEAGPAKIKVSSLRPNCKVRVFKTAKSPTDDPSRKPIFGTPPPLPVRYSLAPPEFYYRPALRTAEAVMDPACTPPHVPPYATKEEILDAAWYIESDRGVIRGCGLDMTMEYGLVYQPMGRNLSSQVEFNSWVGIKTRPFEIEVPPLRALPTDPKSAMDALADLAVARAGEPIEIYDLHVPPELHARPYHDIPMLAGGTRFLEMRPRIARALYAHDDYREWVMARLRAEAEDQLAALERRYRKQFPGVPDSAIREAVRLSEEGRAIELGTRAPSEADLQRHLAAWLGDITAYEMFVRWEREQIDSFLRTPAAPDLGRAIERWQELRRLFVTPSYARVLALLMLTYDPGTDRIGFWRLMLPRPGWMNMRTAGWKNRQDISDIPLDLIPDYPFALWVVADAEGERPDLAQRMRQARLVSLDYVLDVKPGQRTPHAAFKKTRVRLIFEPDRPGPGGTGRFEVVADIALEKKTDVPSLVSIDTRDCDIGECEPLAEQRAATSSEREESFSQLVDLDTLAFQRGEETEGGGATAEGSASESDALPEEPVEWCP